MWLCGGRDMGVGLCSGQLLEGSEPNLPYRSPTPPGRLRLCVGRVSMAWDGREWAWQY